MIIPVRCFSCGRVVASDYVKFHDRVNAGEAPKAVMDDLTIRRYCCRRMIVTQSELLDDAAAYV